MIDYSQVVLIIFGVVLGSFLGVEYGNWRVGRRLSKYGKLFFELIGINPKEFEKLSPKEKRALISKKVQELFNEMLPPVPPRPPPPSRVITFKKSLYIPHCPHCFCVAAAVDAKPGQWVEAICPTCGPYKQRVPGEKEE